MLPDVCGTDVLPGSTWKHIRILKSLIKVAGTISADTVGAIYRSFWIFGGKHISRCQQQVSLTKHKH